MNTSLLWIVPKSPWPATDGAKVASFNLLKGCIDSGAKIHLVIIPTAEEEAQLDVSGLKDALGISEITLVIRRTPQQRLPKMLFMGLSWLTMSHLPLTAAAFATPAICAELDKLVAEFKGDFVVYDGLHCAAHLVDRSRGVFSPPPYIYRAHNREAELWRRKGALGRHGAERKFFANQAKAMATFEGGIVRHARGVATVSAEDRGIFLSEIGGLEENRLEIIPIGYEFGGPLPFPDADPTNLLFIGRLDWPPNREGLAWFLREIWPYVVSEGLPWRLTIAGSGNGEWLRPFGGLSRVEILGFVPDITPLYERSAAAILPLKYGGGTRVKGIEASRFGRVCISTQVGIEGLGLNPGIDLLTAETAEEWRSLLRRVVPEELKTKGLLAWQNMQQRFDRDYTARTFLEFIRKVSPLR